MSWSCLPLPVKAFFLLDIEQHPDFWVLVTEVWATLLQIKTTQMKAEFEVVIAHLFLAAFDNVLWEVGELFEIQVLAPYGLDQHLSKLHCR